MTNSAIRAIIASMIMLTCLSPLGVLSENAVIASEVMLCLVAAVLGRIRKGK